MNIIIDRLNEDNLHEGFVICVKHVHFFTSSFGFVHVQITAEYFEAIEGDQIQSEVVGKLVDVLIDTSDPIMSSKIKNVLKEVRYVYTRCT